MDPKLKKISKRLDAIEGASLSAQVQTIQEYFDYFDCMMAWHTAALAAWRCSGGDCT